MKLLAQLLYSAEYGERNAKLLVMLLIAFHKYICNYIFFAFFLYSEPNLSNADLISGGLGIIWSITFMLVVVDSPADHQNLSNKERALYDKEAQNAKKSSASTVSNMS